MHPTKSSSSFPTVPPALSKTSSTSSILDMSRLRRLHLLIASNGPKDAAYAEALAVRVSRDSSIEVRAIVDDVPHRLSQEIIVLQNRSFSAGEVGELNHRHAFELVEWADILVLAPIDADHLAKMVAGIADNMLLEVLRGWNTSKPIIMVPGMSTHMWENPVTKHQLSKIKRKWNWIRIWQDPILWHWEEAFPKRVVKWDGFKALVSVIKNKADVLLLEQDTDIKVPSHSVDPVESEKQRLPIELWLTILEFTDDWELAQALGLQMANIPMPPGWSPNPTHQNDPLCEYMHELEWTLLRCKVQEIYPKLAQAPQSLTDLSPLAVKLIIKFDLIEVLTWLENNNRTVFWNTFGGKTLPTKASASWSRPNILEWWKTSPSFLEKQYDNEAMDGASKNGHINALEWWRRSRLPLKYTDTALEQATLKGQLLVLEWWRDSAMQDDRILLKPGRSLILAAQHGSTGALRWWDASGIPVAFGDKVCKVASSHGHLAVLDLWNDLKGDNLGYDYEVLVGPTKNGKIEVLEWWRKYAKGLLPGLEGRTHRVEYKTCDIEEALEDSIGDQKEIRRWWAENGLNLGLGTNEWMSKKCL